MRVFKHNWPDKLLALGLAVILFFFVRGQQNPVLNTLVLPISIQPPAGQRVVLPAPGSTVRVDMEGPADVLKSIATDEISLKIDISNVKPGETAQVPVQVELPEKYVNRGVQISWRPSRIQVRLISDAIEQFPVIVRVVSRPDGWELRGVPEVDPSRVTVSASANVLERVADVIAPLILEDSERISTLVRLQAVDRNGVDITDSVRLNPEQVLVTGLQRRVVLQKQVPIQPVLRLPPGYVVSQVNITPSQARLVGPERLLNRVQVIHTEPLTVAPNQTQVTREVPLQDLGRDVQMTPRSVKVEIKLQPPAGRSGRGR